MRILVTDGDSRAALAITRSLGRNHEITVGAVEHRSLASVSRWCRHRFAYPDPFRDELAFVQVLSEQAKRRQIDVVMPVTDVPTLIVARHRAAFSPQCRIPIPSLETLQLAANKVEIMSLAQRLGVPTPAGVVVSSREQGLQEASRLGFPVVIKPGRSRVQVNNRWLATSVRYADDRSELDAVLSGLDPAVYPVLLQERVRGPGVGLFLCYAQGRPVAVFSHRRLREKPPSGGVSVLRESTAPDPVALPHAQRLLEALHWDGVAMVEFKRDDRDGGLRLMEINGRFWGSLQLAIDAGVDFPDLLIRTLDGGTMPAHAQYRTGVRSRWLWGDVDSLLMRLLKQSERNRLPANRQGRWQALREFFAAQGPDCHWEVLRADDLRPWLLESWRWLARR